MPLSRVQGNILRVLAAHRSADSFVAGSTPLHEDGPRYSGDIDIFHDDERRLEDAAANDAAVLAEAGFTVRWERQRAGIHTASVAHADGSTRLEWVRDSDFRFFPAVADPLFGYRLHLLDIATNKALAAAGRQAPRDALDLLYIHDHHLPLGAVIWAAVGKDPGFSPESLVAEIRRNSRYQADEYEALSMAIPVDAGRISRDLRAALEAAEAFARGMPPGLEGRLFFEGGKPVEPDPSRLASYDSVEGHRKGIWPGSSEIESAMLERYGKPPA